jgi:hypothetical protein
VSSQSKIAFTGDKEKFQTETRAAFRAAIPTLEMLASRWRDEHEYEDINEYQKVLQKALPALTIVKMTKRPFGCIIEVPKLPKRIYWRLKGDLVQWGFVS